MAEPHGRSSNGDMRVAESPPSAEPARTLRRFRDELLPAEAAAPREPPTTETEQQLPGVDAAAPAPDSPVSLEERKRRLAETLQKKLEQGYRIESQTDTDAILVTRGVRRWFGMLGSRAETRQRTSIDEHGRATTRRL